MDEFDLAAKILDETNHRLDLMLGKLIEELGRRKRWYEPENVDITDTLAEVINAVAATRKSLGGKNG